MENNQHQEGQRSGDTTTNKVIGRGSKGRRARAPVSQSRLATSWTASATDVGLFLGRSSTDKVQVGTAV